MMYDPDIQTWDEDGDRLDRDREIDNEPDHGLTHYEMRGPVGQWLTPGCICGFYSSRGEQSDVDRHLREKLNP